MREASAGTGRGYRLLTPASDNFIFLVGAQRDDVTVLSGDGAKWAEEPIVSKGTSGFAIHGTSFTDVWFVGAGAEGRGVFSFDSGGLSLAGPYNAIWAVSANDAWAVGDGGRIAHWQSGRWKETASSSTCATMRTTSMPSGPPRRTSGPPVATSRSSTSNAEPGRYRLMGRFDALVALTNEYRG
jgi:hypothetical protein